jgi:hypothetical protein
MRALLLFCFGLLACGCGGGGKREDSQVGELGSIEVSARLVEVPEGAVFKRELYDYATVLKYEVEEVHRGELVARTIFVAHYNPTKPRAAAADDRVKLIGGNLERFVAGERHRIALAGTVDDEFMGGVVNKYFGQTSEPVHWAVWTDLAD